MEIPLSIAAWVSVVLIQAIIHYVVFGVRRERIQEQQEEEAVFETVSLSTSESFTEHELEPSNIVENVVAAAAQGIGVNEAPKSSSVAPISVHSPASSSRKTLSSTRNETLVIEPSPHFLMQTGNDLLKSCSLENLVEEQLRAVAE
mmetsp:Transcript_8134/g.12875  ORF Transcript_8134/g.12875 Transcript_8134/m.12875 type:complete len:146 (+) Transcript_8134:85-522(+)